MQRFTAWWVVFVVVDETRLSEESNVCRLDMQERRKAHGCADGCPVTAGTSRPWTELYGLKFNCFAKHTTFHRAGRQLVERRSAHRPRMNE